MFASIWLRICMVAAAAVFFLSVAAAQTVTLTPAPSQGASQAQALPPGAQAQADYTLNLTAGQFYQIISQALGAGPYTCSLDSGALPPGLTMAPIPIGCRFSGRPTSVGTFSVLVSALSSDNQASNVAIDFIVAAPVLALAPAANSQLAIGRIDVAGYSQQFTASGGTAPYSYAVTGGSLPTGLTLNSSTGLVSGTPTAGGNFGFSITATDSTTGVGAPFSITQGYGILIRDAVFITTASPLPGATIGAPYNQQFSATGGDGPSYTFALTAGALPAGLTLTTTGTLSGTPTAGGSFNFTVTATDPGGYTASKSFQLTVAAPTIAVAPASLPGGTRSLAYSQTLSASGGTAPYSYAVTAGALPTGLTLSSGGTLSGTPTVFGSFNFTVTATDSSTGAGPYAGSRAYTLAIAQFPSLSINDVTVAEGNSGTTAATFTVSLSNASGVAATVNYATADATANAGSDYTAASGSLTFAPGETSKTITVLVTGDHNVELSETFTVSLTNPAGATIANGTGHGTISNDDVPISITTTSLPNGDVGVQYSGHIGISGGGAGPYSVSVTSGALPAGVQLGSGNGALYGAPTASGTYTFSITATDSTQPTPSTDTKTYTITIAPPTLTLTPASLSNGKVAQNYFQILSAGGGTWPYTIAVTSGALPPGVALIYMNPWDVRLSGDPTAGGVFSFTITATDSTTGNGPHTISRAYTIAIAPPDLEIQTYSLADARAGVSYNQPVSARSGTAPYSYAVTSGALPAGLTLNPATGNITGTTVAIGPHPLTITATDSSTGTGPFSVSRAFTLNVVAPTITLRSLPIAVVGAAYTENVSASGGVAPYTYALLAGALPAGLTLAGDGTLWGTPTAGGTFGFVLKATDANGYIGTSSNVLLVSPPAIILTPSVLPDATVAAAYSQAVTASGGTAPYSYAVTAGGLPAGLTLTTTGTLSGTPTAGGSFNFTITATDSSTGTGPYTGSRAYTLVVNAPTIAVAPTSLPDATVAAAYSQSVTASGGVAPYSYAVTAGALPAGVTLTTTGTLSGTPTAGGDFNVTITATDSSTGAGPYTGSQAYVWTVLAPAMSMTPAAGALPAGRQSAPYAGVSFAASGGTSPHSYAVTAGALPSGLTLNPSTGALTGTPMVFGPFSFSVTATDSSTGSGPYTVTNAYTLDLQQDYPNVAAVSPTSGPTAGGTVVTITGANFQNASSVTFGGAAAASYVVNSPTSITATTPAHAQGAVDVAVATPGGTATLANGYTYIAPGAVRFVVNSGDDDGSFAFSSATPDLNFTVQTSGGTGSGPTVSLAPGSYGLSFTTPDGFGLDAASCSPATSTVNTGAKTASLVIASNVTTVCTIEALGSRRAAVETIGAALDASSRLILANAPALSRRIDRLNGRSGGAGSASAFGKTFASNLPFSASIGVGEVRFSASLSGMRALADADHRFNAPANGNGVPASLAASVEPASGMGVTAAGEAAAATLAANRTYRFDAWVEGTIARFDGAANSDGDFAIIHAGADYLISDNVLLGVGVQGDWMNMDTASGSLDSAGWLAGPYLTARLSEGLYLDLRAAWGGASFDVSPFGTYTDTVDSDRELYSAALIGAFTSGTLTIRPEARLTWYKETTDAYVDSLSVAIPSVEIKTGEVTFGPTFAWSIVQPDGAVLIPSAGFDLVWTFQQDNTATQFTGAPGLDDTGLRGRIEAGLDYQSPEGVSIGAALFYDGIGGGDYSAWGGSLKLQFGF